MILIFPILLFPFNFSAFAVDNLIDSNLTHWGNIDPDYTIVTQHYNGVSNENFYQISFKPQVVNGANTWLRFGQLYDISELTAGNSYTLKYHLYDYDDCVEAGLSMNEEWLMNGILKYGGNLVIGVGSYSETIEWVDMIEGYYVLIDKDNYLDYFGKDNTFTFELPSISNPCIYIYYGDAYETGNTTAFYFSNFTLVDNEQESEDNFFSRLFEWFENKFKQLFNVLLYLDPDGEEDYNNPFAPNDTDVNGGDNLEYLQNGIDKFVESVENLTLYLRVPSEMLTTLGNRFPIIPIIVVFTLVGLVVMRLFGVRRDS